MNTAQIITQSLNENFTPEVLEVLNESHKHAGHMGDDGTGNTHFHIKISASAFAGKSRVEREKLIRKTIIGALPQQPHAISFEFI